MLTDEALFEKLLAGDLSAFDALYARHERHLFGFVLKHLSDPAEAEDVFNEAFLAVLKEGRAGRQAARFGSFRAWLFQVARNLCLNRLRSRKRAERAIETEGRTPIAPVEHAESALEKREAAEALRRAVERLPAPFGELYALRASGMSYEELAGFLEIPLGTVKSRMHEMVKRLREEMLR